MWKVFWTGAAIAGVFSCVLVYASANSTFLFISPKDPDVRIVIDQQTGGAIVQARGKEMLKQARPIVAVLKSEYDFGLMDPHKSGRHDFIVENVGKAPLKLELGETSCKCTVGGLAKNELAPGEKTTVTLEWNTGSKSTLFSHYAVIRTNDEAKKDFELRISGKVRMLIGTDLPELVLGRLEPGQPAIAEVYVYSQVWDRFTVQDLEHRLTGMTWEMTTLDPSAAPELQAKSLQKLRLSLPAELASGDFTDALRLSIVSADGTQTEKTVETTDESAGDAAAASPEPKVHFVDLPIHGKVLGRVTYFGGDIQNGAVDFGTVPFGVGKKAKVLVKIRDGEPNLGEVQIETYPETLKAHLAPHGGDEGKGLYELHIELPAGTPPCAFRSAPQGHVRVTTSHPRVPKLEIPVRFAVLQKSSL